MHSFTTLPTLLHPKSTGKISLRSSDPLEHPIIDPSYLSHPDDMESLVAGMKIARKIHNSEALRKYHKREAYDQEAAGT